MRKILKPQSGTQSGTVVSAKKIPNFNRNWFNKKNLGRNYS